MVARRKNRKHSTSPLSQEVTRLRSQVARLRAEVRALKARRTAQAAEPGTASTEMVPALPAPEADGNYPAAETLRALLAQQIVRRRKEVGWTQAQLAARAGVRQETVSRLETGKHAPTVTTVDKIERALRRAGA